MKLIIIEGATSTGKTALARHLAKDLKVRLFLKDAYKEAIFDSLNEPLTLKQAHQIERDSWQAVFKAAESAIRANESLIVEGNFFRSHRRVFKRLLESGNCIVVEVYCYANGLTVLRRYVRRNRSGERHTGHKDHLWYVLVGLEAPFMWLEKYIRPLRLSPSLLKVDTSDFSKIDYKAIERHISEAR